MEKEKKQFTISDYIIVIVGFLTMIALVVFWSTPAHASTQQVCDYKLTEQDQDFVAWYKKNVADNERYNKLDYVVIVSGGDFYSVYYSDKPLYSTEKGENCFPAGTHTVNNMFKVDSSGSYSEHILNQKNTWSDNYASAYFGSKYVFSNYNISVVDAIRDNDGKLSFSPTGKVFFLKPLLPVATMVQELPKVLKIQVREIVVVAVGCLALLIGSIVLLPKLRLYLL